MAGKVHHAPPCFPNDAALLSWRNMNLYVGENAPSGYCTDCTPAYQAQMCAAGRCNHPETSFIPLPNGGVEGRRAA